MPSPEQQTPLEPSDEKLRTGTSEALAMQTRRKMDVFEASSEIADFSSPDFAKAFCESWSFDRMDSFIDYVMEEEEARISYMRPEWMKRMKNLRRKSRERELDNDLCEATTYKEGMQILLSIWNQATYLHPRHLAWLHIQEERLGYVYAESLLKALFEIVANKDLNDPEQRARQLHALAKLKFGASDPLEASMMIFFGGKPPTDLPPGIGG